MKLKHLQLLLIYARDYLVYACLISLLSYYIYFNAGKSALQIIIWFKLLTTALGLYAHQKRKAREVFFFMNNGIGKRTLISQTAALDVGIWLLGFLLIIDTSL